MGEDPVLVRIAVLCRLLREALNELGPEIPTSQLARDLTVLQERAESELSRSEHRR